MEIFHDGHRARMPEAHPVDSTQTSDQQMKPLFRCHIHDLFHSLTHLPISHKNSLAGTGQPQVPTRGPLDADSFSTAPDI